MRSINRDTKIIVAMLYDSITAVKVYESRFTKLQAIQVQISPKLKKCLLPSCLHDVLL